MRAQLEQVREEEESASARGREPALEQRGHVVLDIMAGDDDLLGLTGAVEDFGLLLGEEPGREGLAGQPFFLDRP